MIKYENGKLETTGGADNTLAEFAHLTTLLLRHQWRLDPLETFNWRQITEEEIKEAFAVGLEVHKARNAMERKWMDLLMGAMLGGGEDAKSVSER